MQGCAHASWNMQYCSSPQHPVSLSVSHEQGSAGHTLVPDVTASVQSLARPASGRAVSQHHLLVSSAALYSLSPSCK